MDRVFSRTPAVLALVVSVSVPVSNVFLAAWSSVLSLPGLSSTRHEAVCARGRTPATLPAMLGPELPESIVELQGHRIPCFHWPIGVCHDARTPQTTTTGSRGAIRRATLVSDALTIGQTSDTG